MRVAVTGANGAVGQAILRQAPSHRPMPPEIVAVVRSDRAAAALRPLAGPTRVAHVSYDDPASLAAAFEGVAAVIHLAGILVERGGSTYADANVETTRRVADAAKRCGAVKLVFVSATGADERASNRYWRSKGDAEAVVRASGVSHTIVRVPMLLGRATEAALALRGRLRRRTVPLLDGGRTLQQPLDVDDLARAALTACDPGVAKDRTLELVGPVAVPAHEIVERAARLMNRRIRIVSVPRRPARLALAIVHRIRGCVFSPDVLDVLTTDTKLDPTAAARELGIELTPLDAMIRTSVQP
jgi:uncharacterized protein YbjT (DUF2867 family)